MVDQIDEAVVVIVDVENADRFVMQSQLEPCGCLEQLFHRTDTAGSGDETVCQIRHQGFALVHVLDDVKSRQLFVSQFLVHQIFRNDTGDFATEMDHFIGKNAHQPHFAAAIDQRDVFVDHFTGQLAHCVCIQFGGAHR